MRVAHAAFYTRHRRAQIRSAHAPSAGILRPLWPAAKPRCPVGFDDGVGPFVGRSGGKAATSNSTVTSVWAAARVGAWAAVAAELTA